ncbi:MAG: hypothetical protein ACRD0P_03895 [Stackebrandtia sp.]
MTTHNNLEVRYRRLLRFYPKEYRAERGDEILDTYLESAPPERTRPELADIGDIAKAGLRQRFRYVPGGLPGGLRLAAVVALSFATATAFGYTLGPELVPGTGLSGTGYPEFGPFASPGVILWALWMAMGVAAIFLPGRLTRLALCVPLLATLAAIPFSYVTGFAAPTTSILVPQLAFAAVALAWPQNPGRFARFAPALSMPAGLVIMAASTFVQSYIGGYREVAEPAARLLLVALAVIAVRLIVTHRGEGWFAAAVLAVPAAAIAVTPVLTVVASTNEVPGFFNGTDIAAAVATCGIVGLAVPVASYLVAARRGLTRR